MFGWYKLKKYSPRGFSPTEYWDRKYEQDGTRKDAPEEYRKQLFYPLLMKYLEPGKTYLDAGCGLGGWLAFLRSRGIDIVGVESSRTAVELAKRHQHDLPIEVGDVRQLRFSDNAFDGYLAIGVWEYFEDGTEAIAREAHRVVKPGGYVFVEVPYSNPFRRWTYLPLKSLEAALRTHILRQRLTFSNHVFRKGDLRTLLEGLGFDVLEIQPHDLPEPKSHYGLWVDWPFFRGARPYELNALGRIVKRTMNALSPWMIATGMFVVVKKA